jgi:hypothetical protein
MGRPDKITPKNLKIHINAHQKKKGLKVGWDAFCAMADAHASIQSMADTFKVQWRIMDKWRSLYEQRKAETE